MGICVCVCLLLLLVSAGRGVRALSPSFGCHDIDRELDFLESLD